MMTRLGFSRDQFAESTVIDVGPGPTGRLSWLQFGRLIGIDPLYEEYLKLPDARFEPYTEVHNAPAEQRLHFLESVADAVLSLNCLDHGYDFCASVINIRSYLKPGGLFCLSMGVDIPFPANDGHPLLLTHQFVTRFLDAAGFAIQRIDSGRCYPLPDGTWHETYSGGPAWHWWTTKRGD